MPRPLPKKSRISREPSAAIPARPKLAVQIARIATAWSRVEERLGYVVVQLLGAHAHTGMKMYQALSGAAAQQAVLRAVARDRLSAHQLEKLESILADYKKVAGQRNKVIHGQWEISADHPDELVWYDSGSSLLTHSEFWAGYHANSADEVVQMEWLKAFRGESVHYLLYSEADFEEIMERIRHVFFRLMDFVLECEKVHRPPCDAPS